MGPKLKRVSVECQCGVGPTPITAKDTIVEKDEGYYVASSCMQGWRPSMEDSITVQLEVPEDNNATYFGVFDGHGGPAVSLYASRHLHRRIIQQQFYREGNIRRAIEEGFLALDAEMLTQERIVEEASGSTAVICLIKYDRLYCGNAGDSRAVACTSHGLVALSTDHKPTVAEERARILEAGGTVEHDRVNGHLSVSRGFGDFDYKSNALKSPREQAVTCFPDVVEQNLTSDWKFLVLACDGIWDVMTSNEVVDYIRVRMDQGMLPERIIEDLLSHCLAPNGQGIGTDNMTVVLVLFLQNLSEDYLKILERSGETATTGEPGSSALKPPQSPAVAGDSCTRS